MEVDPEAMNPFYASPLARIHDLFYGDLARAAADFLSENPGSSGYAQRILDLGCGSGVLAARLAEQGHAVTGIDISASMIAMARQRVPNASFQVASIYDIPLPDCDGVCAIGEVLNYVSEEPHAPEVLPALFRRIRDCLSPSGIFLFDIVTSDLEVVASSRTIELDADTRISVTVSSDPAAPIVERRIQVWERHTAHADTPYVEIHRQQLLDPEAVTDLLRRTGFSPVRIQGYGGRPFRTGVTGFYCLRD